VYKKGMEKLSGVKAEKMGKARVSSDISGKETR